MRIFTLGQIFSLVENIFSYHTVLLYSMICTYEPNFFLLDRNNFFTYVRNIFSLYKIFRDIFKVRAQKLSWRTFLKLLHDVTVKNFTYTCEVILNYTSRLFTKGYKTNRKMKNIKVSKKVSYRYDIFWKLLPFFISK